MVLSCADSLTLQPLSFVGFDSPVALLAVRNTSDHSSATLPPVASLADPVRGSLQLINTLLVYLFAFAPRSFPPRRGLSAIALAPPPMLGLGIQPADSFTSISAAHELTGSSSILERHPHATDTEIGSTLPLPLESVVAFSPTVAMVRSPCIFVFLVFCLTTHAMALKILSIRCA